MGTNVQKISISIPAYLYARLASLLAKREMSGYITRAVEEKLLDDVTAGAVSEFIALRPRLPKVNRQAIEAAVVKGRT